MGHDDDHGHHVPIEAIPGLLAEQMREAEAQRMMMEDLHARWLRLISEELTPEQLEVTHWVFGQVANCAKPRSLANYYEGQVSGARNTRRLRLGEGESPLDLSAPGRHAFVESPLVGDPGCAYDLGDGRQCDLPVFNRVHAV